MKRDFLKLSDCSLVEYGKMFVRASEVKRAREAHRVEPPTLAGKTLALVFEKASTRTRVSFESAVAQLGGHAISLPSQESQMSRGETLADTARVISRYVDIIVMRTFADARLREFASSSTVPVINGLTDTGHPVQVLADLFTIHERLGGVSGKKIAFIGDGSGNMALSFIEASKLFDFELRLASPKAYRPPASSVDAAKSHLKLGDNPVDAASGADVLVTDVWTSMGQEAERAQRVKAFQGYIVDDSLLAKASRSAIVLHCLPAHRGEEISASVLDGPRSAAWDEAENRLHVQKALLELLLLPSSR
jgi:ornithine carbamoyltransferase